MNGIVIIGGSTEAHRLARALPSALVRLPTPERVARRWPGAVSFGPVTADWLRAVGAGAVIEAAHPANTRAAFAAAAAARAAGVPILQLVRASWRAGPGDRWVSVRDVRDAARVIPRGARVLVTTGREALPQLRALRAEILMRRIGQPVPPSGCPLPRGRWQCADGPISVAGELRLMRRERIEWLLVPNAGGLGGLPKLAAARALHLPVAMIDRPRRPDGPRVITPEEALRWLQTLTS
ncbi:precorrin-6A/cobalt-precorrin-6A reductase [Maliponia aquimaris]|uniref:Precorrin-6A reductase n=1 Tax=Maliponia aquimaris TaxID=1673631 RepID=A0A238L4W6_9RHOB|nr:precorrin-6A/cobalt-precorrin-6A reductase [Maliponia aquimaris]SMX50047.1 Precorrin-6A reductase [Maliponia aquimaris]